MKRGQAMLSLHRMCEQLVKFRTMQINDLLVASTNSVSNSENVKHVLQYI
ncbi:MAG: hypothetical protein FWG52_05145 [Proteobacteria bacterium]|nr:hypothetical protein [Pseudomonadota bacterium]